MKLVFVTDNGFSVNDEKFYFSGANVQHYSSVTGSFDDITFIARNSKFDNSTNEISSKYKTHLINSFTSGKKKIKNFLNINKVLENEIKNSDIVMCFGLNGYLAYKKAKKYGKPVIVYMGGCISDSLKNMNSKPKKLVAPIISWFIKGMVFNADYVHYVDDYLIHRYPTQGEYLICPSAKIDVEEKYYYDRIEKINNNSSESTKIIGLIGYTHNPIKGIDTAIKSLKLLEDNYVLQIVGRGDHTWLDKIATELGVENQVEYLGILEGRTKIFEWLDSIDIYIQPSLTEGMPRATLEAISRACPVVSTSAGGLRTLIDSKYRIKNNDYKDLARIISNLTNNKKLMLEAALINFNQSKNYQSSLLDLKRNDFYSTTIKKSKIKK